jgi:flagellar export protein FliJ
MTTFKFRLKRVLDWRRTQLELAEVQYKQQAAELAALDRARAELEAEGVRTEYQVRSWNPVAAQDLAALGAFRVRVQEREIQIDMQRAECARKLEDRQRAMMEARRRCTLLERLEQRRFAEWRSSCDKELEELASESFLAKWRP